MQLLRTRVGCYRVLLRGLLGDLGRLLGCCYAVLGNLGWLLGVAMRLLGNLGWLPRVLLCGC